MPAPSALRLEELTLKSTPASVQQAQKLLLEYGEFVAAQPSIATFCHSDLREEAAQLPHSYLDQGGGSLVAHHAASPAGFVAWRDLKHPGMADAWELKRLWIRPSARGIGAGKALMLGVFTRARAAGKKRIVLDTAPDSMAAAYRLYLDLGFSPCESWAGPASAGLAYLSRPIDANYSPVN